MGSKQGGAYIGPLAHTGCPTSRIDRSHNLQVSCKLTYRPSTVASRSCSPWSSDLFTLHMPQLAAQRRLGRALILTADHLSIFSCYPTRPPFREPEKGSQVRDCLALYCRRHHFFETRSFIAARSSICSVSSFFSLAFLSSSAFSLLAFDTVLAANLSFQFQKAPPDKPCLQHRSTHFAPASCSARMPMI